ncbi:hypothetical protein N7490_005739 [Penicillium lividum]|nr:hypothetical protein N7490_005739 [Penicillium lividum]
MEHQLTIRMGHNYILVGVDYKLNFTFAKPTVIVNNDVVLEFMKDEVAPIFGWLQNTYADNGRPFISRDLAKASEESGVSRSLLQ